MKYRIAQPIHYREEEFLTSLRGYLRRSVVEEIVNGLPYDKWYALRLHERITPGVGYGGLERLDQLVLEMDIEPIQEYPIYFYRHDPTPYPPPAMFTETGDLVKELHRRWKRTVKKFFYNWSASKVEKDKRNFEG